MTRLALSFLGTLQIALGARPITRFRSVNAEGMLIYLALNAAKPVPRDLLGTLFWPEETEQRARANVRQNLHQLRKLLGDTEDPAQPFLLVTRQAVQFNKDSDYRLDVQDFLAAGEAGDLAAAAALYQGELLPGFTCDSAPFEAWLRQERQSLHRRALTAMHDLTEEYLQAGRLADALAVGHRQLELEAWRETAHRQLMRAYALRGDRANALAQYTKCRQTLQRELDIAPAAQTTALYEEIRDGRFAPAAARPAPQPPRKAEHNLPAETAPLIGRERDLENIVNFFSRDKRRLVTIVGPGGIGKSRLALAAGYALLKRYRNGVYIADLAPLETAAEIPTAIAAALDFAAADQSQSIFPQLLSALRRQRLLLILDNVEHLLAVVGLVKELLQACPEVAILATSRQQLNLAAGVTYELGGLDYPQAHAPPDVAQYAAVQLFMDSARRVRPGFTLREENEAAVSRICRMVEGMPLALLLATAWLELLSPAGVAAEIESGLDFLAADLDDLPPRQHSMQAVFARSWDLMTSDEQRALAGLSIFRGGFTLEAAEQVAGADLRLLLSLAQKSLIHRLPENGRFSMHELLRQFAALRRSGAEQIALQHCRYYARLAQQEYRLALGFLPFHMARKLPAERANLRRAWDYALQHGLPQELLQLSRALQSYSHAVGRLDPWEEEAISALRRRGVAENDPVLLHLRLLSVGMLADHQIVRKQYEELLDIARQENLPRLCYWTAQQLALLLMWDDDPEAITWIDTAVEHARATGDDILLRQAEAGALWWRVLLGRQEAGAQQALQKMLAFFEHQYPDSWIVYGLLWSLAEQCRSAGDFARAIAYGKRCMALATSWHDLGYISTAYNALAGIYLQIGESGQAARQVLELLRWHLAIGQVWQTIGFLYAAAINYTQMLGGPAAAVPLLAMVYYHPEAVTSYKRAIEEACPRLKEQMGEEAFNAAWERGKEMDFETAVAIVRAALSQ